MEDEQAELTVTIESGSDPIAGRLALPNGSSTPFEGYVELIAALERLRGEALASPPKESHKASRP